MYPQEILFNWQQEIQERFAVDSKTGGTLLLQIRYNIFDIVSKVAVGAIMQAAPINEMLSFYFSRICLFQSRNEREFCLQISEFETRR